MKDHREPRYQSKGRFKLTLNMSSSAFSSEAELPRILRDVADRIEQFDIDCGQIIDINGNTCGLWEIKR